MVVVREVGKEGGGGVVQKERRVGVWGGLVEKGCGQGTWLSCTYMHLGYVHVHESLSVHAFTYCLYTCAHMYVTCMFMCVCEYR